MDRKKKKIISFTCIVFMLFTFITPVIVTAEENSKTSIYIDYTTATVKARGIALDSEDNIYITDGRENSSFPVTKIDKSGNNCDWGLIKQYYSPKSYYDPTILEDGFYTTGSIAIDSQDNIYVVEGMLYNDIYLNDYIVRKYAKDGSFIRKWEGGIKKGTLSYEDKFKFIGGIAVDSNDDLYVPDYGDFMIQKYDVSEDTWSQYKTFEEGEYGGYAPDLIAFADDDTMYVTTRNTSGTRSSRDKSSKTINIYYPNGDELQWNIFQEPNVITLLKLDDWNNRERLNSINAMTIDSQGNIYIALQTFHGDSSVFENADTVYQRVLKFNSDRQLVDVIGGEQIEHKYSEVKAGSFVSIRGLALDSNNGLFIADHNLYAPVQCVDSAPPNAVFSAAPENTGINKNYEVVIDVEDNSGGSGLDPSAQFKYIWSEEESISLDDTRWDSADTFEDGIKINSPEYVYGQYYLHAKVWDNVGNEKVVRSESFGIDSKKPSFTITPYGDAEVDGGGTYVARRDYKFNIKAADDSQIASKRYRMRNQSGTVDTDWIVWSGDENEIDILASELGADETGLYFISVEATDLHGNIRQEIPGVAFNIDTSIEGITIDSYPDGSSYSNNYNIEVTVSGSNDKIFYQWTDSSLESSIDSSKWQETDKVVSYDENINGEKYLHVKADISGITEKINKRFLFDTKAPAVSIDPLGNEQPEKSVSASVYAQDNIKGIDINLYSQWKLKDELDSDENLWNSQVDWADAEELYNETVTKNDGDGEYILFVKAVDSAVNEAVYHSESFTIDNTPPAGTINIINDSTATGYVDVDLTGISDNISGKADIKYIYSTDEGATWSSSWIPVSDGLQVSLPGEEAIQTVSVQMQFKDVAGNTSGIKSVNKTVDYSPEGVTAKVEYSTTERTNQPVTATLIIRGSGQIINNDGSNTYEFTENGTFYFQVKDDDGNIIDVKAQVYNIDNEVKDPEIIYSATEPTNKNVTVKLIPKEEVTILNNDGSLEYEFTENNTFVFELEDLAGNRKDITVKADNIDKEPPVLEYTKSTEELTSQPVEVRLTANEDIIIKNNLGSSKKVFESNGTFTFKAEDMAGNQSEIEIAVSNIDKEPPNVWIEYSTKEWTSENVTAQVLSDEDIVVLNNNGSDQYEFNVNGSYYFKAADMAGNWVSAAAKVENIDKESPVIKFSNDDTLIFIQDSDYNLNDYTASDDTSSGLTEKVEINYNGFDILVPGDYEIIYSVADNAGNKKEKIRKVKVIPSDLMSIFVNGHDSDSTDKVVLYQPEIRLDMFNLKGDIKIKLKAGRVLQSNMKTGGAIIDSTEFTASDTGWYTLYIQDQERNTKLIYVYVASTN